MSQLESLKKLILLHERRLQKLRERKALMGASADPETILEIEDIESEIKNLRTELSGLGIAEGELQNSSGETSPRQIVLKWAHNGRKASLYGLDLRNTDLRVVDLQGADLRAVELSGADLSRASLQDVDLRMANLFGANLFKANLKRADLRGANLSKVNLKRADLEGANLIDAVLNGADLDTTILAGVNFCGTNLSEVNGLEPNEFRAQGWVKKRVLSRALSGLQGLIPIYNVFYGIKNWKREKDDWIHLVKNDFYSFLSTLDIRYDNTTIWPEYLTWIDKESEAE